MFSFSGCFGPPLADCLSMTAFFEFAFDWIFGCHHRHLSRVFTIERQTYQVCFACGGKLRYSWRTMSLIKPEPSRMQRSFVQMWAQMMSNLQDPFLGEIK